jgi:hypothetical protein
VVDKTQEKSEANNNDYSIDREVRKMELDWGKRLVIEKRRK